jgi:chromosome segregation ATPase
MDEALQQYMANVEATQRRDHADAEIINHYTQLADRKIAAEARSRALDAELADLRASSSQTQPQDAKSKAWASKKTPASTEPPEPTNATAQLRQQLAEAQKARALLETEVAKLPGLQSSNASQNRQLITLEKEILSLKRRIGDKDEEIREKQKLAERVQDDMISLTLEVNMAEERAGRLQKENKELVDRWMKEMGSRADTQNKESGW